MRSLITSCPNLEELGFAMESNDIALLYPMMELCPGLRALRILIRADEPVYNLITSVDPHYYVEAIARKTWTEDFRNLRWLGMGPLCFELGKVIGDGTEARPYRREVRQVTWEDIKHVDIFGMDTLEI
jgi:hypothetical protein